VNINQAFPSKYVQASDLQGQTVTVQIALVQMEEVGDEEENLPVVYFSGMKKGMVLNRTNAATIAALYGEETDRWRGAVISIYPTETQFGKKMVPCIRVKTGAPANQPAAAPTAPLPPPLPPPVAAPLPPALPTAGQIAF
jgi:hypothetical protein